VLNFLMTNDSVPTGAVDRDAEAAAATSLTISGALLANLATLPVSTSSGGFVYRFNSELGTAERASSGFGPFFVERALSAGAGTASLGVTFQHWRFTSLDGRSLRDGTLITTANQFADEVEPFETDRLTLAIDAQVATLHGSAGLTDRLEVGVSVPTVLLRLRGSRVNEYRGQAFTQARASARTIGFADMVVRTKYTILDEDGTGLAAAVEARLPTGREADLLGAGSMSWRIAAIGSLERGLFASHVNLAAAFGGLASELGLGGALAAAASDRVTVTGELVGRWIDSPGRIRAVAAAHPVLAGVQTLRLLPRSSSTLMIAAAPGLKWNVADTWVLVANAAIPLTGGGLTTRFTPYVGIDYAIER
jgi:hypothetical protein